MRGRRAVRGVRPCAEMVALQGPKQLAGRRRWIFAHPLRRSRRRWKGGRLRGVRARTGVRVELGSIVRRGARLGAFLWRRGLALTRQWTMGPARRRERRRTCGRVRAWGQWDRLRTLDGRRFWAGRTVDDLGRALRFELARRGFTRPTVWFSASTSAESARLLGGASLALGDVNGDGRADLCGYGPDGV